MDTLVRDLTVLIDKHLSSVEDIFLNNVYKENSKNIKVSVRLNDWRSTLYHLQRWRYQEFIIEQAYYGACQCGDYNLMQLFNPNTTLYKESVKHLAKYKHYDLIDTLLPSINNLTINIKYLILRGLIAANEIDVIKNEKYADVHELVYVRAFWNDAGKCIQTAVKYNRTEILDFFIRKCNGSLPTVHQRHIMIGKIKGSQEISIDEISLFPNITTNIDLFIKYNRFDLAEQLIDSVFEKKLKYAVGLIKADRRDLLDKLLIRQEGVDLNTHNKFLTRLYIETNDLQHFKSYYQLKLIPHNQMVLHAIHSSAVDVLKYLIDMNKPVHIFCDTLIKDPRIVDIIKEYNNIKIEKVSMFENYNRAAGYNLIADSLPT